MFSAEQVLAVFNRVLDGTRIAFRRQYIFRSISHSELTDFIFRTVNAGVA
jgi:hypothetical protein